MTLRSCLTALLLVPLAAATCAQAPRDVTDGEVALLPPFCPETTSFRYGDQTGRKQAPYWVSLMGKGFWTMHHYCWAKINQRRILSSVMNPIARSNQLGGVIDDLNFVTKNSSPDFIMLPEIYSSLGEVELLRKNPVQASGHFDTARKLNPGYAPPYYFWSEYLISIGKKVEAKAHLKTGLEHNKSAANLQALYRKLGGDPAAIVALQPSVVRLQEPAQNPVDAASAASAPKAPDSAGSSPQPESQ